ncbi:type I secretion C-terminal target domain-containing protein [Acinetobacter oleivorans]|uniref:type I secretion C-terminal target domain-containing protein n=2 Tax=Acinetobacter oleivorans TaxID=1148157 RepID=UPI0009D7804C
MKIDNISYQDDDLIKLNITDTKEIESMILLNTLDAITPILTNLFSYDVSTDKIIFNAPSDSYIVEQKVDNTWVQINLEEKFDWLNTEFRVTTTDQAGNISQPLITIINTASGTYKPTDTTSNQIVKGSTGNDYLYGGDGNDTLISNTGSDYLYAGAGNDTLIYGGNSNAYTALLGQAGNDTYIIDKVLLTSSSYIHILDNAAEENTLQLKSVSSGDISLRQSDSLIIISFNDSASTIRFGEGQLSSIVFDDGTVWDKAQIEANTIGKLLGTDEADALQADAEISTIYGLGGNDTIQGGVQNDYLYGGDGDDTLISNTGSDYLYGGAGNDTLVYGGNSSSSYIHILDNAAEENTLQLKSVSSGDISLRQSDSLIIISFNDSASTIRFGKDNLSSIVFDDGTVWDKAQIEANTIGKLLGTDEADALQADAEISTIYGLGGNDTIQGGVQNDYLYGGDGNDTLISNTGTDYLYGGAGNDTLVYGGNSNAYTALLGQAGNDTYIIDKVLLTSSSYIHILDNAAEENTLQLKSVLSSDILLKQSDSLIIISFNDSASTIRFGKDNLSSIVFDDGTVWDKAQIEANTIGKLLGTDEADALQADAEISTIYGLGGNDTIQGGVQNDYLYGGDGDDTLISNTGSDYLYGGAGNDTLVYGGNSNAYTALLGQTGDDTYIVDKALFTSSSYIHILDNAAEENTLQLKSVLSSDILLKQSDSLIIISFNDSASTIRFGEGQLSSIVFDDGTVWNKAQIEQHIAEPVFGTTGNDVIETNIANQTYSYILGDGADTVVFNILDNTDNLGGNVKSEWTDFNLVENDKVDLSQLLINENGNLQDYISVKDTEAGLIISVDRDGSSQSTYHSQELILLTGKHDTLENLIALNTFIH